MDFKLYLCYIYFWLGFLAGGPGRIIYIMKLFGINQEGRFCDADSNHAPIGIAQHDIKEGEYGLVTISSSGYFFMPEFLSSCSISLTESTKLTLSKFIKEKLMGIDIERAIDFSDATIDDLIIADIKIKNILERLKDYDYEMKWLSDKHEDIKDELNRRLKQKYRAELMAIEKQLKEQRSPDEIKAELQTMAQNVQSKLSYLGTRGS